MTKAAEVEQRPDTPVRKLRKGRGLTQEQFAEKVGCDQTTISAIELGNMNPSLKVALAIATELGATLDELFGQAVAS